MNITNREHWIYFKNYINDQNHEFFNSVYSEIKPLVSLYKTNYYGNTYESRRESCVFVKKDSGLPKNWSYHDINTYTWDVSQTMTNLKLNIEDTLKHFGYNVDFDYCLVHIYRDGNDKIDKHSDRESLNNIIASLSLGATRKFRFQKNGVKSGHEEEFHLENGDLLIMKEDCQKIYHHWVPVEKRVLTPRINFTFRKIE